MKKLIPFMKRSLMTLLMVLSATIAFAANEKRDVAQVTEAVTITEAIDYRITNSTEPFTTAGSVDIVNTEHGVVIFTGIKPSIVLKNWLSYVYINGEKAVDGENCQVKMYGRGTIIFPYGKDFSPLTCYTEQNFEGESCSDYTEGHSGGYMKTLTESTLNNKIRSFKLKRGYMVTFAIGTAGWGYSRCFIADQEDLEFKTLPSILDHRISSYRIFKWFNAHKAGIAEVNDLNVVNALNASWCYRMWPDPQGLDFRPDCEYVPHHYKENYPTYGSLGHKEFSCHIKGNNEPGNSADEGQCDVDAVLANWEDAMRTGMRLLSESSHDGSMNHLRAFIDSIDARGWRCDILDIHSYWTTGQYNNLTWYSDEYGHGRPIWVSEWIWGASWNNNGAFGSGVTDAQILSETKNLLNIMNNNSRVERYAYWNSESKAKLYNGGLTELGKYYSTMDVGLGYNPAAEFIPRETPLKNLTKFTSTYNSRKGTVALSWSDPNSGLIDEVNVQCQLPGESTFTTIATLEPKDKTGNGGVSYAYTDTITGSGAYTYRIQAVAHNNKSLYTEVATVNAAPSQGNDFIQYGCLKVSNTDKMQVDFSTEFADIPAVFMGIISNKNTKVYPTNYISGVNRTRFSYQLQPLQHQDNGESELSKDEEIDFMAMLPGNYTYGSMDIEVGETKVKSDTIEVKFTKPFPAGITPVVIVELKPTSATNTYYTKIWNVTNEGFKATTFYEIGRGSSVRTNQTLFYAAFTPGSEVIDEENGIVLSAGISQTQLWGSSARKMYFTIPRQENGATVEDTLHFEDPYIFTTLQTYNYPAGTIIRNTGDIDDEVEIDGVIYTNGIRIRRFVDSEATPANTKARADYAGWVTISTKADTPTGIENIIAGKDGNALEVEVINRIIHVKGYDNFELYTVSGTKVASNATQTPGIYIVRAGDKTAKVVVK